MSASHRKISHLPLDVFENIVTRQIDPPRPAKELRSSIVLRLKRFPIKTGNGVSTSASIKTIGELLRTSKRTLLYALDPLLTYEEIDELLQRIYRQCSAKGFSALKLLNETSQTFPSQSQDLKNGFGDRIRCLPTGIHSLDHSLRGGIRVGAVTELVGRAGTGKTQFCFQLCVLAAKYNQGALYIDTERKIALERLREMSRERIFNHHEAATVTGGQNGKIADFSYNDGYSCTPLSVENNLNHTNQSQTDLYHNNSRTFTYKQPEQIFANLTVESPSSTEELLNTLDAAEEIILHRNQESTSDPSKYPVRLLVVDSIAAPMRRDFGSDAAPQRSAAVFRCAQTLKRLAETLNLAVIVINQVGADLSGNNVTDDNTQVQTVAVKAALGISWHHCVSTRLVLQNLITTHPSDDSLGSAQQGNATELMASKRLLMSKNRSKIDSRSVSVVKSNIAPFSTCQFQIKSFGIVEA